ncbi:hypothetical protein [Agromyces humi]|uniref:hypothetical protein n=1 Tax=Agromyces humi TaxID=1766800 RepID=UPI00135722A4|nr:hypothetical protein [Agromyces humi]
MIDPSGRQYGMIRLVRVDGEPKYRAEHEGEHIGYGATLRSACERIHELYVAAHSPGGNTAARYPISTPPRPDGNWA